MVITKQGGVYTATEYTKDGRFIQCQAMSARAAMIKVYKAILEGFISGH